MSLQPKQDGGQTNRSAVSAQSAGVPVRLKETHATGSSIAIVRISCIRCGPTTGQKGSNVVEHTVVSNDEERTTVDALCIRPSPSVDDQLDDVAVGPEHHRPVLDGGGLGDPSWRRTQRSATSGQGPISHLGVWAGTDVQPPVNLFLGRTVAGLQTCFQTSLSEQQALPSRPPSCRSGYFYRRLCACLSVCPSVQKLKHRNRGNNNTY